MNGEPFRARVILSDPPWQFNNVKTGGSLKSGAEAQYATMTPDEIAGIPVQAVTGSAAACFLWVPASLKFSHGGPVLAAWGFRYVGTVYWNKNRLGMGFWFRSQVEELLYGVRGDLKPFRCQLPNLITAPAGKHSEKPAAFHRLIESATGSPLSSTHLELFGRKKVPGWTVTGLELTGRDVRDDLRMLASGRWTE